MSPKQSNDVELSPNGDNHKSTCYSVSQNKFCARAKTFVKTRAVVHTSKCDELHILVSPTADYVLPSAVERNHQHNYRQRQKQPRDTRYCLIADAGVPPNPLSKSSGSSRRTAGIAVDENGRLKLHEHRRLFCRRHLPPGVARQIGSRFRKQTRV